MDIKQITPEEAKDLLDSDQNYIYLVAVENANPGRIVWEMTYRMTQHAGGATKNRLYDDVIFLRKGDYIAYYETDGSHSVTHWNGAPPSDPVNWGITLYLMDK